MPARLTVRRPQDFAEFPAAAVEQGIHQRFEEMVARGPQRLAIRSEAGDLTYGELNGFANSIAAAIVGAVGAELAQTALLMPSVPLTIAAMLGSLKARKAYVPVDVHFPPERLRAMIADSAPAVILTDEAHQALAEELAPAGVQILNASRLALRPGEPNPNLPCSPLDRAYLLYTSGSTGKPKGIEFLHRNLLHTTGCLVNELFYSPSDRVTWLHSPTFGSSIVDVYCCLMTGGTLLPWDVKARGLTGLSDWLVGERATTLQWIPSAFRSFMRTVPPGCVFADLRIAVMAGEPLTITEVELFRRHFPRGSHLVNQMGTAESYNYYLYRVDDDPALEGASVPGLYSVSAARELLILDEDRAVLPPESVGEIGIRSDYMARGYWRNEALTKEKFVRIGDDPRPVYLTGDLGRIGSDGCLAHLGRGDFQIKLRGCRIEVAEIEHRLRSEPGGGDAAVWTAKNRAGEDQLVAYIVEDGKVPFDWNRAAAALSANLPDYMVPLHHMILTALPTLATGKVDRRSLPSPFAAKPADGVEPGEDERSIEREIAGIFREVLHSDRVDRGADFFQEGGDSLMAAVLADKLYRQFGVEIGDRDQAGRLTPANLAKLVAKKGSGTGLRFQPTEPEKMPGPGANSVPMSRLVGWTTGSDGLHARHGASGVKQLLIVGGGEAAREVFAWASQAIAAGAPWRIKGFLDTRSKVLDGYGYEPGVVGSPFDYRIEEEDVFVGALGDPWDKKKFYSPIADRGGKFINLIHPLANVGKNVRFGSGVVLSPFASVSCDVQIGDHVAVGPFSSVAHDTVVGDWCQICSHCGLNGRARLGEGVFLGSHVCVIPRTEVGSWAYAGAGSIIVRNVPPRTKVFGNPARIIGPVKVSF